MCGQWRPGHRSLGWLIKKEPLYLYKIRKMWGLENILSINLDQYSAVMVTVTV